MNKNVELFLISALLLCGGCASVSSMAPSQGCSQAPHVTISINANTPSPNPYNRCTGPGTILKFKFTPPQQQPGTILVLAKLDNVDKGGLGNWLTGSNSPNGNEIELLVPGQGYFEGLGCDFKTDNENCTFDYAIYVKGKAIVDPRVTIKK